MYQTHAHPLVSPAQAVSPAQSVAPYTSVSSIDPYVVEALRRLTGRCVCFETTRGGIEGTIIDVKPDHVLLQLSHNRQACVRIAEIVWTMPL
ncbi:DUF2642 domain-containing protein [Cohnella thailandensis]|uniref:DUF2642 domain-containing protein n=1 Tax=Cohnella thailandensis TaxID=557557 RepID=UPI001D445C40|nr:DUF2642 domain-containing protein [Cohnella thailandensis]MBP1972560.1 hypothetical protein [Cohnella thailandensis]